MDWFRAKEGSLFYSNGLKNLLALNNSFSVFGVGGGVPQNEGKEREELKNKRTESKSPSLLQRGKVKLMDSFGGPNSENLCYQQSAPKE